MSGFVTVPKLRPARRRPSARRIPRLEGLEDRRLLATFYPSASANDGDPDSLRAAIIAANANGQDNTIVLQSATYRLTVPITAGQENDAAQGDLDLTGAGYTVTIQGQGAGSTIIDGGGLDRIFQVLPGVNVVISGVTIQNGVARDQGEPGPWHNLLLGVQGGGILNNGTLALEGVVVQDCTADGDYNTVGGAFGGGIANLGTLTIDQSVVQGNVAQGGKGADGGSSAAGGGTGGMAEGGGIINGGSLTVSQSTIAGNDAYGGPGGPGGTGSGVGPSGGSGGDAAGGGVYEDLSTATMTIVDSTVAGNLAWGGAGGTGGRGELAGRIPAMTPGSYGGGGGDGGSAKGGGIDSWVPFSLYNSTVAANQAIGSDAGQGGPGMNGATPGTPGQSGNTGPAFAGGIWAPGANPGDPGLVHSVSSIIALNTDTPDRLSAEPDDVVASFSNTTDTLLQDGEGATGITDHGSGNLVGVDPKLGPLQDNGGPTPTMALLAGSPAIDAGSNPQNLATDQRGLPRVSGAAADIGAYELQAAAPSGGGTGTTGSQGGTGGAATAPTPLEFSIVRHGWRRCILFRRGFRWIRVCLPYGWGYGRIQVASADIGGVEDLVVRRPLAHHKFATKVFSGIDGSPLPSSLA